MGLSDGSPTIEGGSDGTIIGNTGDSLKIIVTNSSLTVAGTIAATQSGTWNINNISGTISLPTGAATAANQATEIASLASIDSKLTTTNSSLSSIDAGIPAALGQTTMASSMPVAIASNQSAIPASQSGTWSVSVNNGAAGAAVNIQDGGNAITIDSLQLPAALVGGRLDSNLGAWLGSTAPTVGQKTTANSVPVTVASDQPAITITQASSQIATFNLVARNVTIGNNKSMVSLLNASGSTVIIRITAIKILNTQTSAVTGVVSDFQLFRFTGHTGGTSLTPQVYDTTDSLNGSVTARTGSTISGEATNPLNRWLKSSDEWGVGALDTEGLDQAIDQAIPLYQQYHTTEKSITLRANEGIHIKHVVNSTAGAFDFIITFTQV